MYLLGRASNASCSIEGLHLLTFYTTGNLGFLYMARGSLVGERTDKDCAPDQLEQGTYAEGAVL